MMAMTTSSSTRVKPDRRVRGMRLRTRLSSEAAGAGRDIRTPDRGAKAPPQVAGRAACGGTAFDYRGIRGRPRTQENTRRAGRIGHGGPKSFEINQSTRRILRRILLRL